MKLILASNNQHKVAEIQRMMPSGIEMLTMKDAGINIDIPEPYDTIEENASTKSLTIYKMTGTNCFSEDTGLEVEVLRGEPGVKSARYAGDDRSPVKNMEKLLGKMDGVLNRNARFKTVISLIMEGKEFLFEGICEGQIISEPIGNQGFGYDPIFVPNGSNRSFAEMELLEKEQFSHRGKATTKLINFLKQYNKPVN